MEPMITVIIPMYNAEKYIGEAIDSVLNQSFKAIELLVVDDCSTDHSVDVVQRIIKNDGGGCDC